MNLLFSAKHRNAHGGQFVFIDESRRQVCPHRVTCIAQLHHEMTIGGPMNTRAHQRCLTFQSGITDLGKMTNGFKNVMVSLIADATALLVCKCVRRI
jgi:hypothetical protein